MTMLNILGERYGLAPPVLAGLASVTGQPAPSMPAPAPPAGPPVPDPDSAAAWEAAGATAPSGGTVAEQSNPYSPQAKPGSATPPATAGGTPPPPAAPPPEVQGPADAQSFPTVRPMDQGGMAAPTTMGPIRTVPAHWQPGSHTVGLQRGMDPNELVEGRALRDLAASESIAGADKRLEAAQQAGMADAIYSAANVAATKRANERLAMVNAERDRYVAKEGAKLEQLAAETQKQVDPDQFFNQRGDLARVGAAIMMAIGQYASIMTGTPNTAMQIINESIDRNINAQKANIANARAALDAKTSLYDRNLRMFGDRERAEVATKINYLDQVGAMADQQRALGKNAESEAAYHELRARIAKERAGYADDFAKLTHTQATEQMNEHFVPAQTVGGGAGQKGKEALYVPTLGGYARDESSAQKLNAKGAARMQITSNMQKIHGLMEEAKKLSSASPKGYMRLSEIDQEIASLVDDSLTKNTVLEGQGAMSAADKEVAATAKGLKGVSVQFKPEPFINQRQRLLVKGAENMLESHRQEGEAYGIQKGTERYRAGPQGPEPVRVLEGRNAPVSKNTQGYDDLVVKPQGVPQR